MISEGRGTEGFGRPLQVYRNGREHRADEVPSFEFDLPPFREVTGEESFRAVQSFPLRVHAEYSYYLRGQEQLATRTAFNHLANDLMCLGSEVTEYAGRSAARTSRAVLEHCVNMADTFGNPDVGERYLTHESIVAQLIAQHGAGMELLPRRERQKEERRLQQLRKGHEQKAAEGKAAYGSGFSRQWSRVSLFDRCKALGWEDRYDGYRILSSVIHGSAGGLLGTKRQTTSGTIHRLGPSIELIPLALLEAVRSVQALASHAEDHWPGFDSSETKAACNDVIRSWAEMRHRLFKLDSGIWPEMAAPDPIAILGLYQSGERWYWYDPLAQMMAVADEPDEAEVGEQVRARIEQIRAEIPRDPSFNGRPITVALPTVRVRPKKGAPFIHSQSILVPKDFPGAKFLNRVIRD